MPDATSNNEVRGICLYKQFPRNTARSSTLRVWARRNGYTSKLKLFPKTSASRARKEPQQHRGWVCKFVGQKDLDGYLVESSGLRVICFSSLGLTETRLIFSCTCIINRYPPAGSTCPLFGMSSQSHEIMPRCLESTTMYKKRRSNLKSTGLYFLSLLLLLAICYGLTEVRKSASQHHIQSRDLDILKAFQPQT